MAATTIIDFIYNISLLCSAVMAIIFRKYLGGRRLTILLPYLIYVFIQEGVLDIGRKLGYFSSNSVVYNIYRPVTVIVFSWIYYSIPFMRPVRKLIIWLTLVYLLLTLINYCFIESILATSSYLILARGLVITFYGVMFLFRFFYLDNLDEEKYWRPLIWITIGVVTFYSVISISGSFQKYLAVGNSTLHGLTLYRLIPQLISIFMYGCFSYAFYLCKKIKQILPY
jgi:hypothetical protein